MNKKCLIYSHDKVSLGAQKNNVRDMLTNSLMLKR